MGTPAQGTPAQGTPAMQPQVKKEFVDRSRIETYQRCKRLRWLEYHESGMGIRQAKVPLPLAVGGSVHEGLAHLLRLGSKGFASAGNNWDMIPKEFLDQIELGAVAVALADFAQYQAALDIGEEEFEMVPGERTLEGGLRASLGAGDEELVKIAEAQRVKGRSEFEEYLYAEQSALVEGMVRAYARRRLKPLLEQYEVLEVEREGSWLLSEWNTDLLKRSEFATELWFMSRPDALLLERSSKQLYLQSFKTAAKWDRRKNEDAKRDMQGLSEGVEIEKRLAEWWREVNAPDAVFHKIVESQMAAGVALMAPSPIISGAMGKFLRGLPAPPRITGIRYEYMLKGDRRLDKDLTARLGLDVRSQQSPLVRAYRNQGMVAGDEQWNVSWDYLKETGESSKLYWKNWKGAPVFETLTTRTWLDKLDQTVQVADTPDGLINAWSSPAQATGYLEAHPLDEIFIPPIVVYRNDDDLRDWIEQTEAQEKEVAEHVAKVRAAQDEGEKRHLLNVHFNQTRRACSYPTDCAMIPICFGGAEVRQDPLGTKLYKIREANHPQEVSDAKS